MDCYCLSIVKGVQEVGELGRVVFVKGKDRLNWTVTDWLC